MDFYKLEEKIIRHKEEIEKLQQEDDGGDKTRIAELKTAIEKEWADLRPRLTAHQIVQVARHPQRPYTLDYIQALTEDFMEMHGDRRAGDDPAIVCGFAFFNGQSTAFIGHQKGRTTRERIARNFGQPNPEGYRKALRVMKLAEKFGFPIVTLIDTPGAYPGIRAEELGQAEAIAHNLKEIAKLKVPVVNLVIGEGGSGGALAVGVGDVLLMLQNSFYSVISPEGCAAILWKDQTAVAKAAENMKFLASNLDEMGIVDKIIPEPPGGAHVDIDRTFKEVGKQLKKTLDELMSKPVSQLLDERYEKYRKIGIFNEE